MNKPHAFINLMKIVRAIHRKDPKMTKDQIRYGMFMTFMDLQLGFELRPPKGMVR